MRLARGLKKPALLLPIIEARSAYGEWPEYWVNCPRRGRVPLAGCVECPAMAGILDEVQGQGRFLLRCKPKSEPSRRLCALISRARR